MRSLGTAMVAALAAHGASAQGTDLSGGGRFDSVQIGGFVVPLADVARLRAADLLRFDPARERFSFAPSVTSERKLRRDLKPLGLEDPRAVRDLYRLAKVPLPNAAAHTLTVPSGYGPVVLANQEGGVSLGVAAGGVSRVPYTDQADGGIALGLGFGNAFETVGVSIGMSINDLSDFPNGDRIAWGFEVSRYLWDGLSIAVGGESLFVEETDAEETFYLVGSWAFDGESGLLPFDGVATLGIGTGRFANKTERDAFEGKGDDATAVFGALAWEVTDNFNIIGEWNGRNIAIGGAFRVPETPLSVRVGVRDLTDFTGDGPRLTGSVGLTLARF